MLTISKITTADPAIIKIEGRIDGLTSKQIQTEIEEILETGVKNLVLDFAGVYYLSSAGIRVFINEMKRLNATGGQLFFVSLSSHILEIFKISGLCTVFKVFDSYQEITDLLNESNEKK